MKTILAIALGGALGSVLRHFVNSGASAVLKGPFPWGILLVNVLGCFLMGLLVALFAGLVNPSQVVRAFLVVGVLGGFTTFSAFSLDAVNLWSAGDMKSAIVYVAASVIFSIAATFAGSFIVWKVIA